MRVFSEIQRFNQWWFYLILIVVGVSVYIPLFKMLTQTETIASETLWITIAAAVFVTILFAWMAFALRLKTHIDERGIHYQFKGFHFKPKFIPWEQLEKAYVRTYRPLSEYGGWGIRGSFGKDSMAYNVKGNKGLQLQFKDGKRLLIGTQQPEPLERVIALYSSKLTSHE